MLAVLRDYPLGDPNPGEATTPRVANLPPAPVPITAASAPAGTVGARRAQATPLLTPTVTQTREARPANPMLGDLGQKVPFGFVLGGQTVTSASAWPLFYEALLEELYQRNAEKLSRLADDGGGFLQGGKPLFARLPGRLGRSPAGG